MARKKAIIYDNPSDIFDDESGELHAAHELWCRIAELFFYMRENHHRVYVGYIQHKITGNWAAFVPDPGEASIEWVGPDEIDRPQSTMSTPCARWCGH